MKKTEIPNFIEQLKITYPDAKCSLDFTTPFELVIAVMLSAQCTDERVNRTTPILFNRCKTIEDFANINISELEEIIHPCGFFKTKSKNIKLCANQVLNNFKGIVPHTMEELLTLAGVGRKSANVILLEVFNISIGIAVDTHVKRISNLVGLSNETDPEKIEKDLVKLFPTNDLRHINHLLIYHGRRTCIARRPKCDSCTVSNFCKFYLKGGNIK